nr:hypothetical protein [Tanacetum cinerariifolium]
QVSQDIEDSHVTLTLTHSDGQQESLSTSSFVTNLLNPIIDPVFRFEDRVKSLEVNFSELMRTNQSIEAFSNIPDEQQNLYKALVEAYDADKTILDSYGESAILKRRREEDDDQEGPSAGSGRGSKRQREGGEHASASTPSEPATMSACRLPIRWRNPHIGCRRSTHCSTSQHPEWFSQPRRPPTPDRNWNKTLPAAQGNDQSWISTLAKQTDARSSFNELLDTPIDFSNFIMNQLGVDTLTPELLAGPTYELMRGSCNSLIELEYHLEEVYKVTTDQLDWDNPKGQHYPYNQLQPLSLIPDNQGHRVIPFEHFINNDLEHIKCIEDLVPRTMWIQEPLNYDKHALWGVSHWGRKRQQFYGFAVNQKSALDVYSKTRIIAVTDLKIMEWHNYKHLDWISIRKLSNLTVEERFAFKISLRMFTRSIVIQRHVEDLQLGVESYHKRLNLTKPDTYRSDLKRREAYTAYSNPRGFIYQNRDKKNSMRETFECYKGPYDISYAAPIVTEFYGLAVNRESALDVYSKRRIIAVTNLKIVEW